MQTRQFFRRLVVLCMTLSWLAITNHCALAVWSASPTDESCPMHSKPASHEKGSAQVCCKILRAPGAPATVKAAPPAAQLLPPDQAEDFIVLRLVPPLLLLPASDTGPPESLSFAESILQRSILAHAPPSLG